jgi:YesN/AraC family two-component response regulator
MLNPGIHPSCEILYVDDEEKALKYFRMAFSSKFVIHTATSAREGLEIIRRLGNQIGIVISDQRMPEMLGAEFLGIVRQEFPHVVRILTTAYSDLESAIQAVNKGHIYQYVVKPWEVKDFGMVLQRAADYYYVLSERNQLLSLKMSTLQRILSGDRLVWLLSFQQSLDVAEQTVFANTLLAYIRALPDPARFLMESAGAKQLDASHILRAEYANAEKTIKELSEPAALEELSQRFSAILSEKYGFSHEDIVTTREGSNIDIRLAKNSSVDLLARDIFGLLLAKTIDELGLVFFRILLAIAAQKGALRLSLKGESGDTVFTYLLNEHLLTQPNDAIDALYERVSAWDVASL